MKLTKEQQRMVVASVRRQGLEVSPVMPDNVSRWPLALREAWVRGYTGQPSNRDGRVAIERYDGAYWQGQRDRALDDRR